MDFQLLEREEIEYECLLRGVDKNSSNRCEQLSAHLSDAASLNYDAASSGKGLNQEIQLIADKAVILDRTVQTAIQQCDLSALEICRSRLLHILNRILVVNTRQTDIPSINRLGKEIEAVIARVREAEQVIAGPPPTQIQNPFGVAAIETDQPPKEIIETNTGTIPRLEAQHRSTSSPNLNPIRTERATLSNIVERRDYTVNQYAFPSRNIPSVIDQVTSGRGNNPTPAVPTFDTSSNEQRQYPDQFSQNTNSNQDFNRPAEPPAVQPPNRLEIGAAYPNHYSRNPLARWPIKFDGSSSGLPVEEFIFRIQTMCECENVSVQQMATGLHYVLAGNALVWYWLYKRQHRQVSWLDLEAALKSEFRTRDTDYEIRKRADSMRQGPKEAFADFRLRVESELIKLRNPMHESDKLAMLKRNVGTDLRKVLFFRHARSASELSNICRDFEKLQLQLGEDRSTGNFVELCRNSNRLV